MIRNNANSQPKKLLRSNFNLQRIPNIGIEPEELALSNINNQDFDDMNLLLALDKDSNLYKLKLEQYKEASNNRKEIEKALYETKLNKLRDQYNYENKEIPEIIHQNIIFAEKDQRENALERMQKEWESKNYSRINAQYYDPIVGFIIYWDFFVGIELGLHLLELTYSFFESGSIIRSPVSFETSLSIFQKADIIGIFHKILDIPANPETRLIIEINSRNEYGEMKPVGWTTLDLFNHLRHLKYF